MFKRVKNLAVTLGAIIVIVVIVWLDIATGVWSELVILAGLAAGLVTFLLTVFVLDKVLARATELKWAPVNRLALTEFLHALADDEQSEISRGIIVPRELPQINVKDELLNAKDGFDTAPLHASLQTLREQVVNERSQLTEILSRWAEFLASSSNNEQILKHVAEIALQLDAVRDATLEVEKSLTEFSLKELKTQTLRCNSMILKLENELKERIAADDRLRYVSNS